MLYGENEIKCMGLQLLPHFLGATASLQSMVIAQHQFALATLAAHAFGNTYSSWSVELLAHMRMAGKPADVMNPQIC